MAEAGFTDAFARLLSDAALRGRFLADAESLAADLNVSATTLAQLLWRRRDQTAGELHYLVGWSALR